MVALGAHPDDAEAACGGLLLKLARRGYRVAICDLTIGELASNGTPAQRAREASEAAAMLQLAGRLNLALPDGCLSAGDATQVAALVRMLRQHAPRLLIVPHEASRHPDHAATTALGRKAQFFCGVRGYEPDLPVGERPVLLRALDFYPLVPSFVVDIGAELETKLRALRCYASQFEVGPASVPTLLNDPAYLQRIETNARYYGQLAGCVAAEPYVVDAALRLEDPLAMLCGTPPGRGVRP